MSVRSRPRRNSHPTDQPAQEANGTPTPKPAAPRTGDAIERDILQLQEQIEQMRRTLRNDANAENEAKMDVLLAQKAAREKELADVRRENRAVALVSVVLTLLLFAVWALLGFSNPLALLEQYVLEQRALAERGPGG